MPRSPSRFPRRLPKGLLAAAALTKLGTATLSPALASDLTDSATLLPDDPPALTAPQWAPSAPENGFSGTAWRLEVLDHRLRQDRIRLESDWLRARKASTDVATRDRLDRDYRHNLWDLEWQADEERRSIALLDLRGELFGKDGWRQ